MLTKRNFIIQVKFGLYQKVSTELEMFLPSTIFGHVAYRNHVVSSPDENIKKVYRNSLFNISPLQMLRDTHLTYLAIKRANVIRGSSFEQMVDLESPIQNTKIQP